VRHFQSPAAHAAAGLFRGPIQRLVPGVPLHPDAGIRGLRRTVGRAGAGALLRAVLGWQQPGPAANRPERKTVAIAYASGARPAMAANCAGR